MCVLHVTSLIGSFNDFLNKSNLPVYQRHEKGQKHDVRKGFVYDDYGFSCDISDKPWTDVEGQLKDIADFIEKFTNELMILKQDYKISDWQFDVPYECRLSDTVFCQSDFISPRVMKLCSQFDIGIVLSQYWGENEEIDSEI